MGHQRPHGLTFKTLPMTKTHCGIKEPPRPSKDTVESAVTQHRAAVGTLVNTQDRVAVLQTTVKKKYSRNIKFSPKNVAAENFVRNLGERFILLRFYSLCVLHSAHLPPTPAPEITRPASSLAAPLSLKGGFCSSQTCQIPTSALRGHSRAGGDGSEGGSLNAGIMRAFAGWGKGFPVCRPANLSLEHRSPSAVALSRFLQPEPQESA